MNIQYSGLWSVDMLIKLSECKTEDKGFVEGSKRSAQGLGMPDGDQRVWRTS